MTSCSDSTCTGRDVVATPQGWFVESGRLTKHAVVILDLHDAITPAPGGLVCNGQWDEPLDASDAALASFVTGVGPEVHGVVSEWELRPDGMDVRRAPRHRLNAVPVWERLVDVVALGMPWSTGSRPPGRLISADYLCRASPAAGAPLPDRVWPPLAHRFFEDAVLHADDIGAAELAAIGHRAIDPLAREEILNSLSFHAMATKALEERGSSPVMVRLQFLREPVDPARATAFVSVLTDRYRALVQRGVLCLYVRRHAATAVRSAVWGLDDSVPANSAVQAGQMLMQALGLPPMTPQARVGQGHWSTLLERHEVPATTLPGTAAEIADLTRLVHAAVAMLAPE